MFTGFFERMTPGNFGKNPVLIPKLIPFDFRKQRQTSANEGNNRAGIRGSLV